MNADSIKIECDEDGFRLVIHGSQLYHFRINDPEELYDAVKREIGPWLYERDMAQTDLSGYTAARENIENARGGYALDDPKHEDWHSVHADHYDNREKV